MTNKNEKPTWDYNIEVQKLKLFILCEIIIFVNRNKMNNCATIYSHATSTYFQTITFWILPLKYIYTV